MSAGSGAPPAARTRCWPEARLRPRPHEPALGLPARSEHFSLPAVPADVSGKLRIWDTTQKEHLLKYEYQPFAGKIKDIAWTEDSKRIAVVGEGREKFGAVFLWDSGSSVGEITGHNKVINSVDIKQSRPYRLATGSDDNCAAFFEGPPFKFKFTIGVRARGAKRGSWAPGRGALARPGTGHRRSALPAVRGTRRAGLAGHTWGREAGRASWPRRGPHASSDHLLPQDHGRFVNCVRFSPDGNRFATASADGQVRAGAEAPSPSPALPRADLAAWRTHITQQPPSGQRGQAAACRLPELTSRGDTFSFLKIYIYDGKTGEKVCALGGDKAHDGGIYAVSWSPDSTHLLSASGDKTSKIWDVSVNSVVSTFPMGSSVLDQQLGCLWQRAHLLSVSLSGYINYLDRDNPSKPLRVVKGHSKSIQCLTVHKNGGKSYIYSGSHDGHINIRSCPAASAEHGPGCGRAPRVPLLCPAQSQSRGELETSPLGPGRAALPSPQPGFSLTCPHYWDSETGENDSFAGKGHTNQVSRMTVDESGQLVSCSMDDTVRYTSLVLRDYSGQGVVKLDVQPKCVAVGPGGYTVVVCIGQIVLLKDQKKCFSIDNPGYEPEVVAVHPGGDTVAVGGSDGNVRLYSILGTTLKDEGKLLEAKGPVTDLAFSHDGAFLAVCDASKVVTVFSVADGYSENNVFYGHHAKIVCLAWSPDNEHFASGGMDMMVYVWTLSDPETRVKIQDAHRLHHVSSLAWLDEHTLVTTSHDASVKEWTIAY
ncbi:WD repeat-containing protein 1 [Galemys pyrenaicus]|uniref:WD repeat-containing protein 1 n=1 Tax=Galemys pyrenaicus TaxID=202257 RepID=A0A8J5ZTF2_GALPY|nr:WD repeat-containing protein 1 [Galemys pyrenaicus]